MCGFNGVVHWDGAPVMRDDVEMGIKRISHRGPDELTIAFPQPDVGLAHARLRVIDLSQHASQPMANAARTVWLVYNGEIYNFAALRAELEAAGYRFRSRSDTEVILRAYEAWGPAAISRLEGMFALAVWDASQRQLLLARDRMGKKPLYYWTDGACVTFGSEIKALLAHAHVPCDIEEDVLPFLLALGYPPHGQTCYRQIRQVPPATLLTIRSEAREPVSRRYWELSLDPHDPAPGIEPSSRELRQRLTDAVRRRLMADVPLGAFLSGGVDSTMVVGLMAQLQPSHRVKTFSIGFEGDDRFNETRYAQLVADHYHTDHTVFTVTPQSCDLIERLVWHHDQPFGDSSAIPTYLLSELTRAHVTVALSGDGGDELFAGYTRFIAALWSDRLPQGLLAALSAMLQWLPAAHERSLLARAQRFVRTAALPMPERYWRWISYCANPGDWLTERSVAGGARQVFQHPSLTQWWEQSARWTLLSRVLYLNFQEYLPNDLLVKADRCSMAHGLEVRSPFLDRELVEFVAGLPAAMKLRGGRTKWLLRHACDDLLPPPIRHRRKMGFGVPLGAWFRGRWREPIGDYLQAHGARSHRYIRRSAIDRVIREHLAGTMDHGHKLWLLLTIELWLRQMHQHRCAQTHEASQQQVGVVSA